MSWNRAELFAWLDRTEPAVDKLTMFELLEMPPTASGLHVQRAFHAIAKTRHPDVWRSHLDAAEMDRLVHVYGRIAAAYSTLRNDEGRARILRDIREKRPSAPPIPMAAPDSDEPMRRLHRETVATEPPPGSGTSAMAPRTARPSPTTPPARVPGGMGRPVTMPPAHGDGQNTLGARAISFYRRAEASMRVGDIAGGLLNLRMALAAEPHSPFLKDAIAKAQARLKK